MQSTHGFYSTDFDDYDPQAHHCSSGRQAYLRQGDLQPGTHPPCPRREAYQIGRDHQ